MDLASDLRSRMKQHLRDTHATSWDVFSLYLTNGDAHMREIEALVLRIAAPKGNKQRGRLAGSASLAAEFRARVKAGQKEELSELSDERGRPGKAAKRACRGAEDNYSTASPALAKLVWTALLNDTRAMNSI